MEPGESVTLTKLVAYAWSDTRELPALRDELAGALTVARHEGFDGLLASQRAILDGFWECADVEIDGDDELQQAVRFALFQLLQATARAEGRAVAGKALTGTGYEGHAFWDTETFVLQVMTAVRPEVTRHALGWRHATLPAARERAATLDLKGRPSPGGRSPARSAPATGRQGRPPSTSTPTSPTPCCATSTPPATRGSPARPASSCWWRVRACGAHWATGAATSASTSSG